MSDDGNLLSPRNIRLAPTDMHCDVCRGLVPAGSMYAEVKTDPPIPVMCSGCSWADLQGELGQFWAGQQATNPTTPGEHDE